MAAKSLNELLGGVTRFGLLTVDREGPPHKGRRKVFCRCDCGNVRLVDLQHLKRGDTKSCGCQITIGKPTHGRFHNPGYVVWNAMMQRCGNPKNTAWKDYGGRGIAVCARWHDVRNFLADMGQPPAGCQLDRWPDNDGNYEPGNCRWASRKQQARNKRSNRMVELGGRIVPVVEAAEATGIPARLIYRRLDRGWSDADAVTTPSLR